MNGRQNEHNEQRREERREDYLRLESTLVELTKQLEIFRKRFDEVEEVLVSIRSLAKTLQMIERLAVWLAKVGAVLAMGWAFYKFIVTEFIKSVKNGS